eukprot:2552138-Pleurochrysis_carterae.AAC.1
MLRAAADGDADAAADDDDDDDDDADVAPSATPAPPAPLSAGRHATTYELECIRLRQKIDAQRNTINNLEAEIVHLDKKIVRALRERDYVGQEAAAQQEVAVAAAEEARGAYNTRYGDTRIFWPSIGYMSTI